MKSIYDDRLTPLFDNLGAAAVERASHVEPFTAGTAGAVSWTADMGPVNGPSLGPFPTREEALQAETRYLLANIINP
jgi:hypothetical protein